MANESQTQREPRYIQASVERDPHQRLAKLASSDGRSIPKEIAWLVDEEFKRRERSLRAGHEPEL